MRHIATVFFLLFLTEMAFCQLDIYHEYHTYVVSDLENYEESIMIEGRNNSLHEETVGFLVNESAELLSYQLYQRKGYKWKPSKLKKEVTISTIDRSSFFTGTKYYYFPIPAGTEFKLEFSTKEEAHNVFNKVLSIRLV